MTFSFNVVTKSVEVVIARARGQTLANDLRNHPSSRRAVLLWCCACGMASILCWLLPGSKDVAVLGRLNYWQFLLAISLSAFTMTSLLIVLQPTSTRRRFAFRATALWIGSVIGLCCVELSCLLWPGMPLSNPWLVNSSDGFQSGTAGLMVERKPGIYWKGLSIGNLADLDRRHDPYAEVVEFVTDLEGFRNTHLEKDPEIVFIGDSFTEAGNVNEDQTFVSRIGKATSLSVRNLGRINYSPSDELVVLREFGLKTTPRAVVWQFCEHNDLSGQVHYAEWQEHGSPPIVPEMTAREIWMARSPTYRLFDVLSEYEPWLYEGTYRDRTGKFHTILFSNLLSFQQRPYMHQGWPLLVKVLRDGHAMLEKRGIPLVVTLIPMKLRVMGHYVEFSSRMQTLLPLDWDIPEEETFGHALAALCEDLGVRFVDTTVALKSRTADGVLVYPPFESHLSKVGHEVVAQEVGQAVLEVLAGAE